MSIYFLRCAYVTSARIAISHIRLATRFIARKTRPFNRNLIGRLPSITNQLIIKSFYTYTFNRQVYTSNENMSSRNFRSEVFWNEKITSESPESGDAFSKYDSLLVVLTEEELKPSASCSPILVPYLEVLRKYKSIDEAFDNEVSLLYLPESNFQISRFLHAPVGPLDRDYDDIRRFSEAACKGIKRVLKSGSKRILVVLAAANARYKYHSLSTILGVLDALYVPLEVRIDVPTKLHKIDNIGICSLLGSVEPNALKYASAIESGRIICRDIGGSDPECMTPPNVAHYVQQVFANSCIKVNVIESEAEIQKNYPLLAAVNRAARGIERHRARVIFLTYEPEGAYDKTLVLVGKGVTYDTGGADIKAGGVMAGMHRDKCGAAAVAGFFQTLSILKPKGIKVIGGMAMVRNSVGPDGYVADEIITSRAGMRVRVGNTDAEGRMAMADVLCHLKENVLKEKNTYMFTIATLTGHACMTVGDGYSIVIENGPAKAEKVGPSLQQSGEMIGDMFEISTLRREDYEFHKGKSEYEDVLQCNNQPSTKTPRGHQTPAAFLVMSSGLDKHGTNSDHPLKYCHIDIAASSGPFPGCPTGAPIAALINHFVLQQF